MQFPSTPIPFLTLSICTAFLTVTAGGGSGAFVRKSTIGQLTGARSFVYKQISCKLKGRTKKITKIWKQPPNTRIVAINSTV